MRNYKFYIETERLILRDFLFSDENAFYEMDSLSEVHTYLGNNPIKTKDEIRNSIAFIQQQYKENGIGRWATIEKSSGSFIGWSGLKLNKEIENNHVDFYDVGYRLHPKFWGKGYATESAKAAIKFGFENFGLTEIVGKAHEENKASRKALEKCGLTFIEKFETRNLICDWLKITKDDWERLQNKTSK